MNPAEERRREALLRDAGAGVAQERAALTERLAEMAEDRTRLVAASQNSNADDEHDPEGQTIAYERSQLAALTEAVSSHLAELDGAADRLAEGTYGDCEVCGEPIPVERLLVRPAARTCVTHAT